MGHRLRHLFLPDYFQHNLAVPLPLWPFGMVLARFDLPAATARVKDLAMHDSQCTIHNWIRGDSPRPLKKSAINN